MTTARPTEALAAELTAEPIWSHRLTWVRRWLAVSWLALLAAMWRLWTPQEVFPQIPFFAVLRTVPGWIDWVALVGLIAGVGGLLLVRQRQEADTSSPRGLRTAALLAVGSTTIVVLLDQHRFQPWAYQFAIVALVLAFTPPIPAASLLRVLTVGIYFWSAVSKFDYTFLHTMGPQLLGGLTRALQVDPATMSPGTATFLAWTFPIDELAVAILLAIRRTRTVGLVLAVAMHALLLAALGPLGLNHSLGVLLWNVYFIGQNLLLFRRPAAGWRRTAGPGLWVRLREIARGFMPASASAGVGHAAVFLAVWLPALEPFGLLDNWPAWAVYAPGGERERLLVNDSDAKALLPDELRSYDGPIFAEWWEVRTDLWSLDSLYAPIYPQDRFRVGVAAAVAERYWLRADPEEDWLNSALLVVESRADRFTGKRTRATCRGVREIRDYADSFRLNARPRKLGGW
jgi:hypothetical protein